MRHLYTNITSVFLFCLFTFSYTSPGFAEELYRQFSLGVGSLTATPHDVMAPEPGVITAQYGFRIASDFMPYLGTGLAYTYQPDMKSGEITNFKTGVAAQLGFSYSLGTNSTLKLDYKYLSLSPEQPHGDSNAPPQSLGIGLDIKF